jgi:hypothetical protein
LGLAEERKTMLRRIVVVLAMASVGVGGSVLAVSPASARVASANGTCNAIKSLQITPSSDPSANGGRSNLTQLIKKLDKAAKGAKGDFKKTLKTLSSYFKAILKGDTTGVQNQSQAFASAVTKFANYVVTNCVPGGLPNGVTIPTIPSH